MKYQVLIPVKDGMPYIAEAVFSVLRSKGLEGIELEIHISDAGSTDSTKSFLETLNGYKQIHVHFEQGLSREENWNKVSSFAHGDFVRLLCADDRISETSIARSIELLVNNADVSLVAGKRNIIDFEGKILLKNFGLRRIRALRKLSGQVLLKECIKSGTNLLGEPSNVTFRTSSFKEHLPWSDEFPYCLDLALYANVLAESFAVVDSEIHSDFRVYRNSSSTKMMLSQAKQFSDFFRSLNSKNLVKCSKSLLFFSFLRAFFLNLARVLFYFVFVDRKNANARRSNN